MRAITEKQAAVLEFIKEWQAHHGYPPSIREVAVQFKINVPSAAQHLKALERKGLLHRAPGRQRSLVVTMDRPAESTNSFRFVGDIAAGTPLAIEEVPGGEALDITPAWFGRGEHVLLRVRGDSMSGDAISDGDLAVVRLQLQALPQQIAAVRTSAGEITLKRVELAGDQVRLLSSNPAHPTRVFPAEQVEVVGLYAGIIRRG